MSDAYPSLPAVDLVTLHEAIKNTLRAKFPTSGAGAVPTIEYYGRQGERVVVPAIFIELTAIIPGELSDDVGTEQFNATLEFSAYAVISYKDTEIKAKLAARAFASRVLAAIRGQRWGLTNIRHASVQGAFPDKFETVMGVASNNAGGPTSHQYETWRVDFTHDGLLDSSVWDNDGSVVPTEVWVGIDPDTGLPNVLRYRRVVPDAAETDAARVGETTSLEGGGGITADAEVTIPAS